MEHELLSANGVCGEIRVTQVAFKESDLGNDGVQIPALVAGKIVGHYYLRPIEPAARSDGCQ
jgi:hypothetical protein